MRGVCFQRYQIVERHFCLPPSKHAHRSVSGFAPPNPIVIGHNIFGSSEPLSTHFGCLGGITYMFGWYNMFRWYIIPSARTQLLYVPEPLVMYVVDYNLCTPIHLYDGLCSDIHVKTRQETHHALGVECFRM